MNPITINRNQRAIVDLVQYLYDLGATPLQVRDVLCAARDSRTVRLYGLLNRIVPATVKFSRRDEWPTGDGLYQIRLRPSDDVTAWQHSLIFPHDVTDELIDFHC